MEFPFSCSLSVSLRGCSYLVVACAVNNPSFIVVCCPQYAVKAGSLSIDPPSSRIIIRIAAMQRLCSLMFLSLRLLSTVI